MLSKKAPVSADVTAPGPSSSIQRCAILARFRLDTSRHMARAISATRSVGTISRILVTRSSCHRTTTAAWWRNTRCETLRWFGCGRDHRQRLQLCCRVPLTWAWLGVCSCLHRHKAQHLIDQIAQNTMVRVNAGVILLPHTITVRPRQPRLDSGTLLPTYTLRRPWPDYPDSHD